MKLIYTFPLLLAVPSALADISTGAPAPAPLPKQEAYHSELLAANAVHAIFKEIRTLPVVSLEENAPATEEVAVFEVKQNLAYRRYDRMGDPVLQPGKIFPVSLASDLPGQDAALGAKIREMKPGDEALLNIDHIYLFREQGNENVRACTRFVPVAPQATPAPAADDATAAPAAPEPPAADAPEPTPAVTPIPLVPAKPTMSNFTSSARSVESRVSIEPDGQGGMKRTKIEIHREWSPSGEQHVRKFINDVEVDPNTDQPLKLSEQE